MRNALRWQGGDAVWLYYRFTLSLRDVEELLAERGIDLTYETVRSHLARANLKMPPPAPKPKREM